MAEDSGSAEEMRVIKETAATSEELVFQLESDDEEQSDEEYFEAPEQFQDSASSTSCLPEPQEEPLPGTSTEVRTVAESPVEPSTSAQTGKCYDALDYFSKDAHSSSGESKSVGSSTGSAYALDYRSGDEENTGYVTVDIVDAIKDKDFIKLMLQCRVDHYSASSSKGDLFLIKCKRLFERDYEVKEVDNSGGSLCGHYPERLIVPVAEKSADSESSNGVEFDIEDYKNQILSSISSRLRKRFVVPVIIFNKKFICRAGTITVRKTAVFETTNKSPPPRSQRIDESPIKKAAKNIARAFVEASNRGKEAAIQLFIPNSIRKLRDIDAQILRTLKIQYICDLMIEDRKKYKHIRLSSSEKINPDIYRDCNIEQMPYPGCQFFRRYHEANHVPEGLIFNWSRSDVNTEIKLTEDPNLTFPDIEWENYKEWDVVVLTKNYMKVLLSYLARGTGGLLVHCVSGWDRTPLFISLLRLSLWADGVIHKSLDCKDMAYITLAYDWYLFGHDLPSRLRKKEEIMHFCMKFLPYMVSDEFSITRIFHELPIEERVGSLPDFTPGRRCILEEMSYYLQSIYDEFLTGMVG